MKICIFVSILSLLIISSGCTNVEGYAAPDYNFTDVTKTAIIDVTGYVAGQGVKNQIADMMTLELMKKGYTTIERQQVQKILDEQKFQVSDVANPENAAQAGKILNVPAVIIINVPKFKEDINLTAKMIDVETGQVVWIADSSGSTGKTASTIAGAAAGALIGAGVSGRDDRVIGGIGGAVLGGVAGNVLAPQEAKKVKELLKKMCETLPSRFTSTK